ncbi:hypothetical protein C8J56DRAFT_1056923 [Mycena floridula]|nr:hypothetical protein C8J56DRAFT_1056923 [Mycena floridula]
MLQESVSGVLFGLITSQTYVYFKTFPRDSRFTKGLVAVLWVVEMLHTACIFDALYMYTVAGYGDPTSLIRFPVALDVTIILHGATVILVQLFFSHRISKFVQKTHYMSAIAIFILFVRFVAFVASGVAATMMTTLLSFMQAWKSLIFFDLLSCAMTDVMMSDGHFGLSTCNTALESYLSTLAMVDKLIMSSVETCLVTTFTTLVLNASDLQHQFLTMKDKNFIWVGILLVQPKIFSNALLANLNSRSSLRNATPDVHELTNDHPYCTQPNSHPRFKPTNGVSASQETVTFNDKLQSGSPVQGGPFPYSTESPQLATPLKSKFKVPLRAPLCSDTILTLLDE